MAWAELNEEHRMLRDLVTKFVERELMPLEPAVLAREAGGGKISLTPDEEGPLRAKARELGLWGLDVPEEFGGANLPVLPLMAVEEELGRTLTPFIFPPDSPNLHMMLAVAAERQRERYLRPYAGGEARSAMAISEPGAGGDPAGMITRAVPDGNGGWRINGRKIWVSGVPAADFIIVMARTGEGKRAEGVTAFIVERGTPGFLIEREIAMVGGRRTYELVFEDCRVPASQVLGELGKGYAPMQLRLNVRRLQMGARCVGIARRALEMLCSYAKQRVTFGKPLSERQAIQWHAVDMHIDIQALRSMTYEMAARADSGEDVRAEAALVKLCSSEWGARCVDHAIQVHGAMGESLDLPLTLFYRLLRHTQIGGGASEIQRILIARKLFGK